MLCSRSFSFINKQKKGGPKTDLGVYRRSIACMVRMRFFDHHQKMQDFILMYFRILGFTASLMSTGQPKKKHARQMWRLSFDRSRGFLQKAEKHKNKILLFFMVVQKPNFWAYRRSIACMLQRQFSSHLFFIALSKTYSACNAFYTPYKRLFVAYLCFKSASNRFDDIAKKSGFPTNNCPYWI